MVICSLCTLLVLSEKKTGRMCASRQLALHKLLPNFEILVLSCDATAQAQPPPVPPVLQAPPHGPPAVGRRRRRCYELWVLLCQPQQIRFGVPAAAMFP